MAAITTARRKALPTSEFAGPDRSYPVDTAGRARNALSRVSQFGSPELKSRVRAKVAREYPGIEQAGKPMAKKAAPKPAGRSNGNGNGRGGANPRLAAMLTQRLNMRDKR